MLYCCPVSLGDELPGAERVRLLGADRIPILDHLQRLREAVRRRVEILRRQLGDIGIREFLELRPAGKGDRLLRQIAMYLRRSPLRRNTEKPSLWSRP